MAGSVSLSDAARNVSIVLDSLNSSHKCYLDENFSIVTASEQQATGKRLVEKVRILYSSYIDSDKGRLVHSILDNLYTLDLKTTKESEHVQLKTQYAVAKKIFQRDRLGEIPTHMERLVWFKKYLDNENELRKLSFIITKVKTLLAAEEILWPMDTIPIFSERLKKEVTDPSTGTPLFLLEHLSVDAIQGLMASSEGLALLARLKIYIKDGKVYTKYRSIDALMQVKDFPKIERLIERLHARFPCIHSMALTIELLRAFNIYETIDAQAERLLALPSSGRTDGYFSSYLVRLMPEFTDYQRLQLDVVGDSYSRRVRIDTAYLNIMAKKNLLDEAYQELHREFHQAASAIPSASKVPLSTLPSPSEFSTLPCGSDEAFPYSSLEVVNYAPPSPSSSSSPASSSSSSSSTSSSSSSSSTSSSSASSSSSSSSSTSSSSSSSSTSSSSASSSSTSTSSPASSSMPQPGEGEKKKKKGGSATPHASALGPAAPPPPPVKAMLPAPAPAPACEKKKAERKGEKKTATGSQAPIHHSWASPPDDEPSAPWSVVTRAPKRSQLSARIERTPRYDWSTRVTEWWDRPAETIRARPEYARLTPDEQSRAIWNHTVARKAIPYIGTRYSAEREWRNTTTGRMDAHYSILGTAVRNGETLSGFFQFCRGARDNKWYHCYFSEKASAERMIRAMESGYDESDEAILATEAIHASSAAPPAKRAAGPQEHSEHEEDEETGIITVDLRTAEPIRIFPRRASD